jgi:hypothetical protein
MVREGEGEEEGIVEQQRPSFVQDFKEAGLVNACEKQWHRTVTHMNAYPYVWASYFVVYGTCGNSFSYFLVVIHLRGSLLFLRCSNFLLPLHLRLSSKHSIFVTSWRLICS